MLARDYIHDSLYNPHYGYFSRHAVLLPEADQSGGSWDFKSFSNEAAFTRAVAERYDAFETAMQTPTAEEQSQPGRPSRGSPSSSPKSPVARPASREGLEAAQKLGRAAFEKSRLEEMHHNSDVQSMAARQVWHTPTQLFRPHYARVIAEHTVQSSLQDGKPLVVYELGAGSGALAHDFLDYVAERYPDVYAVAEYNIVEISDRLAAQQERRLSKHVDAGKVKVHRKDFLHWDTAEDRGCTVIALEVLDNLAHDVIRYSTADSTPYQTYVSIDAKGDMEELFTPISDPLVARYLQHLHKLRPGTITRPPGSSYAWLPSGVRHSLHAHFPFFPNMTPMPHFVPTQALHFVEQLHTKFRNHRLVVSDFSSLPNAVKGVDGPVVQTRIEGKMVEVTKYTVLQGLFDIFFPTNFELLRDVYAAVGDGNIGSGEEADKRHQRQVDIYSHRGFLEKYGEVSAGAAVANGDNPMLAWYENAKWLIAGSPR